MYVLFCSVLSLVLFMVTIMSLEFIRIKIFDLDLIFVKFQCHCLSKGGHSPEACCQEMRRLQDFHMVDKGTGDNVFHISNGKTLL